MLGASGGMGFSIVNELLSRGIMVTAFARTREKLEKLFGEEASVTIFSGDMFDLKDLDEAAAGVDIIYYAANIPYNQWKMQLPILMSNILQTAEKHGSKLAIVDNIYAYGRSTGNPVSETTLKLPHTIKGNLRLQMETQVKESNVSSLIAHFPDFYGPNAENTALHFTLSKIMKNKKSSYVGNQKIQREFIYTPDGAKAIVQLSLLEESYGQNWNIPGHGVISGEEIINIIRENTGYQKGVSTVSKKMIQVLGMFNSQMRELVEMFYLYENPVVLNGEKYENLIGKVPRTSYQDGLKQTIDYMKRNQQ